MVVNVVLFLLVDAKVVVFIKGRGLNVLPSLLLKEFEIEPHHDFLNVLFDFLYEGIYYVLGRVEFVETTHTVH